MNDPDSSKEEKWNEYLEPVRQDLLNSIRTSKLPIGMTETDIHQLSRLKWSKLPPLIAEALLSVPDWNTEIEKQKENPFSPESIGLENVINAIAGQWNKVEVKNGADKTNMPQQFREAFRAAGARQKGAGLFVSKSDPNVYFFSPAASSIAPDVVKSYRGTPCGDPHPNVKLSYGDESDD
jgi:hypothetical protein